MRRSYLWNIIFIILLCAYSSRADDVAYDSPGLDGSVRIVKVNEGQNVALQLYGGSKYQIERKTVDGKVTVVGSFSVQQSAPLLLNGVGNQGQPPEGRSPVPFKVLAVRDDGDVVHVIYRDGSTIYGDVESSTFAPAQLATGVDDDPSAEISGSWTIGDATVTLISGTASKRVFSLSGGAGVHSWKEQLLPNPSDPSKKITATRPAKSEMPTSQPSRNNENEKK